MSDKNGVDSSKKRFGGSGDIKLIGILVAVTLAIGVVGILAAPIISAKDRSGDYVTYSAILHKDGTLDESYTYSLTGNVGTRMLYRYWEENLVYGGSSSGYITLLWAEAPPGSIAYVKNYFNDVSIIPPSIASDSDLYTIRDLAYTNEVGCYNPGYFSAGTHTVRFGFKIDLETNSNNVYDHLNIMLARDHLPYKSVMIVLEDADYIYKVYPHPPSLTVSRVGNNLVITGSSMENELLEVELLMPAGAHSFKTYLTGDSDIKGLTEQANTVYSVKYWAAVGLGFLANAAVLLTPFLLLGLWYRYGREPDVTVPTYLSTVPNPERKPWLVNLVFSKSVNDFDEDGFYSTLIDLHERKKIRIESREGGMRIYILDAAVEDSYEKRVLAFLDSVKTVDATQPANPVAFFDTDTLKAFSNQIVSGSNYDTRALLAQRELRALTHSNGEDAQAGILPKVSGQFFTSGRKRVIRLLPVGIVLIIATILMSFWAPIIGYLLYVPIILGFVCLAQAAVAYFFPSDVFGSWSEGMFKEKKQWDAFRAHLSDLSQLSKYSIEDLPMWGSWLVYGTALGVGDKVASAMKELNVKLDIAPVATIARTHFRPIMSARPPPPRAPSGGGGGYRGSSGHRGGGGSRGGGSRGGGGGRGGGGAGRR